MGIKHRDLTKYIENLEKKLSKKAVKSFIENTTNNISGMMIGSLKEATPVGETRQLRLSWIAIPARFEGEACRSALQNDTYYAPYVEYGHRQTYAWGKKLSHPRWVEGQFFMTSTIEDYERVVPQIVNRSLDQYLEGL